VREAMQSDAVAKLLENEKIKKEFGALNAFLGGLGFGHSFFGAENVRAALEEYRAGAVLVNDSVLNDEKIKGVLDVAYGQRVEILVFNSEDDAGVQLHGFKDIAAVGKSFLEKNA